MMNNNYGDNYIVKLQKVREQGIRFWDKSISGMR